MSYLTYKILHVVGALMVFLAIGGAIISAQAKEQTASYKKRLSMMHGIGLLVSIVAGFGALAKLGASMGGWVIAKVVIWVAFGGFLVLINRKPQLGNIWLWVSVVLGFAASYLAISKPF